MVLILSIEKSNDATRADRKYASQLTTYNNQIVVFSEGNEVMKPDVVIKQIQEGKFATGNCFFTRFDIVSNENIEGSTFLPSIEPLMNDIFIKATRRENVTIVHRGMGSQQMYPTCLLELTKTIRSPVEYAMQLVADEIAKEKQMQRLLQLEIEEEDDRANEVIMPTTSWLESRAGLSIPLSKRFVAKLREQRQLYQEPNQKKYLTRGNNRFAIISSLYKGDLRPPYKTATSLIPQSFLMEPPPQRSAYLAMGQTTEKTARRGSYGFSQGRRSTLTILNELRANIPEEEPEYVKGNGWPRDLSYYLMNGDSSLIALPGIPHFEDLIKNFTVDFMLRTDCRADDGPKILLQIPDGQRSDIGQLFQIGLNWYPETGESLQILIRDSNNRLLEGLVPLNEANVLTGKSFHHFQIIVRDLETSDMECYIDGKSYTVQYTQQECPISFNPWTSRIYIGGSMGDMNNPLHVLRGSMIELCFWKAGENNPTPIVRWPLLADSDKLKETIKTNATDYNALLENLQRMSDDKPKLSPYFDGNMVMNMGTMSILGELLHNWRFEIRFRTTVTTQPMSLLGVTDWRYKMQEIGLVLNAEPILSKERFRFRELNIAIYLVDAFGSCCSALVRGTEHQNLMDGEWHTIIWRCIDSETNNFTVKVDGVKQDLMYVMRDGPSRFTRFSNWVCIGGHNVRNWKVRRPFIGQISRSFITCSGVYLTTLHLNEGPGAYVLHDYSGHHNHGLLISPITNAIRRHDIMWVTTNEGEEKEGGNAGLIEGVSVFNNNKVSIAAVIFSSDFSAEGAVEEVVYDLFSGAKRSLQTVEDHISDTRPQWKTWRSLSDDCYKPLDTITQLDEAVNDVIKMSKPLGHLLVVIRIGDCHISHLQLVGPILPVDATYDRNMLIWRYPFAVEGKKGRCEIMLNRMIEAVDRILISDTLRPFTTAKLGPLNTSSGSIVTEDIIQSLKNTGKPWYLPSLLHNLLLNAEYGSHLHVIHHTAPVTTPDEALSITSMYTRLQVSTREKATLIIQRNWKALKANRLVDHLRAQRVLRDRKVEEIKGFRMNPSVQAKEKLFALVVLFHSPTSPCLPPIADDTAELEDRLCKQGYYVEKLSNPSRKEFVKTISTLDTDKSLFVYISGYGGNINIQQPPLRGAQVLHMTLEEGNKRATLENLQNSEYKAILETFKEEKASIKQKKNKKKKKSSAAAAPPPPPRRMKPEELEMQKRQHEAMVQSQISDLENEEMESRSDLRKEYDSDSLSLTREIHNAMIETADFIAAFRNPNAPRNFLYPSSSKTIEPFTSQVMDVEDILDMTLRRSSPPLGFQCVVAIDLEPVSPFSCGFACIASSTDRTFRFPYRPQQRRILTRILSDAFTGNIPRLPTLSKYAILTGVIETLPNQRDWMSFASFIGNQIRYLISPTIYNVFIHEMAIEKPYLSDLIPIREEFDLKESMERIRRERETQKVQARLRFAITSHKAQTDMFALFKDLLKDIIMTEIKFSNIVNLMFPKNNRGLDQVDLLFIQSEVFKTRPSTTTSTTTCTSSSSTSSSCELDYQVIRNAQGIQILFNPNHPNYDKLHISQWINNIIVQSLSWRIPILPFYGCSCLDIDSVELMYDIKINASMLQYISMEKQLGEYPIPMNHVRVISYELISNQKA